MNLAQAGSTARMVMRAKGHLRLILNAKIFPGMARLAASPRHCWRRDLADLTSYSALFDSPSDPYS